MENLGGHCLSTLCEAFDGAADDWLPVFLAYTVKGWGTPLARHKDNHAGLMTPAQMAEFQAAMGVSEGQEWEPFAGVDDPEGLRASLVWVPFFQGGPCRLSAPALRPGLRAGRHRRRPLAARAGAELRGGDRLPVGGRA